MQDSSECSLPCGEASLLSPVAARSPGPSNPSGHFSLQSWYLSLLCRMNEWGLQISRPLYSSVSSLSLCDSGLFVSLGSMLFFFNIRAPGSACIANTLENTELGSSCLFSLRNHWPVLPSIQYLENHFFKYFYLAFLDFRKDSKSRSRSQLILF